MTNDDDKGGVIDAVLDAQHYAEALRFETEFRAIGWEHYIQGKDTLGLWPKAAWKHITAEQRQFRASHREALKDIVRRKLLPETTVTWTPELMIGQSRNDEVGSDLAAPNLAAAKTGTGSSICPYCLRKCVGRDDRWYRIFHWSAPDEIARRSAEATAEMRHQVGHS